MLRIAFLGTPELTLPLLEVCAAEGRLVCVVAQPDRPIGRSSQPQPPPSKRWAEARGIPVLQPLKVRNGALAALLAEHQPDVAIVAAYGRILPKDALETPRLGCLNMHASLLPKLRGAAPAQWAVALGLRETGVTLMQMDEGLDTGDMLLQRRIAISDSETGESLLGKLALLGAEIVRDGLRALEAGTLSRTPQDHAQSTLAPILTREDGRIDWARSSIAIDQRRRGFFPWPGATTSLDGAQLKIHASVPLDANGQPVSWGPEGGGEMVNENDNISGSYDSTGAARAPGPGVPSGGAPGEVLRASRDGIDVRCGDGSVLRITELQPEGKKRMPASAFLAGHPLPPGTRLG